VSHDPLDNPIPATPEHAAELADLYAIGALSRAEAAAFEKQVAAGQPAFVAEFERIQPLLTAMLNAAEPVTPPPALRAALAREFGATGPREPSADQAADVAEVFGAAARRQAQGIRVVRGGAAAALADHNLRTADLRVDSGRWYPTLVRGVQFRSLVASRRDNRRAILLNMGPGTELPEHGHTGTEQIIMLSGDLVLAETTLGPHDTIIIPHDADHGVPRTTGGCVCVVVSGYQPFPISSWLGMAWSVVKAWFGRR
jgi:putative transcriptional regulator